MQRPVRIAANDVRVRRGANGVVYLQSTLNLGAYPERITDRLERWAERTPDRVFLAQRGASGAWRTLTYADALLRTRRLGQALVDRGLSETRPLLILSGNSIEHALLALAAMHTGVVYAPIAPAYSLHGGDFAALRRIVEAIDPALVFADDGPAFERVFTEVLPHGIEAVTCTPCAARAATPFADLESRDATGAVDDR